MWDWITALSKIRATGDTAVVVTVSQVTGSTPREPGAKMIVQAKDVQGTIGGGHLEELAIADARKLFADGGTKTIRYPLGAKTGQCCGGVVELLFEAINTGPRLYLFGAGHVGQAVTRVLQGTPFRVTVIDERKEWIDQLPDTVSRHEGEWDDFFKTSEWDETRTYVVVMTHRHDLDQEVIEAAVKRPARYIGLIGSESKWARFKQRMSAKGIDESQTSRVRCPIGVPTGGKAPQEVAISLAAELVKMHYNPGTAV